MTAPFDQPFYDRLMDEPDVRDHATHTDGWMRGYAYCAIVAARIAAEQVAVSDEELGKIAYYAACSVDTHEDYGDPDWDRLPEVDEYAQESHIVAARAVRAALSLVPQLPEGWRHEGDKPYVNKHTATLLKWNGGSLVDSVVGTGPTWLDALNAAIAAAQNSPPSH